MTIERYCSAWLAPDGSWPRDATRGASFCPEAPTTYACVEEGTVGGSDDGAVRVTGTTYLSLCDEHATEVKTRPGWAWSRPLGLNGGA